jgi:hypothetical protein
MKEHLKHLGKASLSAACGTAVALVILFSFALVAEGITRAIYYFNSRRFIHPYLGETYKPLQERTGFTPEGEEALFLPRTTTAFAVRTYQIENRSGHAMSSRSESLLRPAMNTRTRGHGPAFSSVGCGKL